MVAVAVDSSFESVMRAVVRSVVGGRWLDFCFSLNEEGLSSEQRLGPVYGAIVKKPSCRRLCIRRPPRRTLPGQGWKFCIRRPCRTSTGQGWG